jgi:hypothetical protein
MPSGSGSDPVTESERYKFEDGEDEDMVETAIGWACIWIGFAEVAEGGDVVIKLLAFDWTETTRLLATTICAKMVTSMRHIFRNLETKLSPKFGQMEAWLFESFASVNHASKISHHHQDSAIYP